MGGPDRGVAGDDRADLAVTARFRRVNHWLDVHPTLVVAAAALLLAAFSAGIIWGLVDNHNQNAAIRTLADDGKNAHDALCVFRNDLAERVASSRKLIQDHPEILKISGLSLQEAWVRIHNQQLTVDALSTLNCSKGEG